MDKLVLRVLNFLILCVSCLCHSLNSSINDLTPLILTPFIKNGSIHLARTLSEVDVELFLDIKSYSGFITVKEEYNSNLFFWYFPHEDLITVPWIIWLNGGPGASSLYGLFEQIGPVWIDYGEDKDPRTAVKHRNTTWASDYSILFIDNPVGAGFSFTDDDCGYTTNEDEVASQLYEFLEQFLELFPEQKMAPLFIAGESYAGKYVPAFAMEIHRNNHKKLHIHLKGISLGNPLIHPRGMMKYNRLIKELGIMDEEQLSYLQELENSTELLIDQEQMVDAANKYNETIEYIKKITAVSVYNYLKDPSNFTFEFEDFLIDPLVRKAIHVGTKSFDLNNQVVYNKMLPDIANTTKPMIEKLLNTYGVLCYHGQLDLFIPYSLSKLVYKNLQWPGRQEYLVAPRRRLRHYPDDRVVGYKKAGGNFMEILVRGCGHMVPNEEPEVAKFIINLFINMYK